MNGDWHTPTSPLSTWHSNVTPGSLAPITKVGVRVSVMSGGPDVMVVLGGVSSTTNVAVASVGSVLPNESAAADSERGARPLAAADAVKGDVQSSNDLRVDRGNGTWPRARSVAENSKFAGTTIWLKTAGGALSIAVSGGTPSSTDSQFVTASPGSMIAASVPAPQSTFRSATPFRIWIVSLPASVLPPGDQDAPGSAR